MAGNDDRRVKCVTWESECLAHVRYFAAEGDVALLVLWNKFDQYVAPQLPPSAGLPRLGMGGNLRTPLGISFFIRGLYLHPHVGTVVIWGQDYTQTAEALLALWRDGPTADHHVPDLGWKLDSNLDAAAVEAVRHDVQLVDCRGLAGGIPEVVARMRELPTFTPTRQRREFPPLEIPLQPSLPSRGSGLALTAGGPDEAWLKVVNAVMRYGTTKGTRKEETLRQYFHIGVTFPVPVVEAIAPCFNLTSAALEHYYRSFASSDPPDAGVDYRYGQRLQNWRGHNQLQEVIARLRRAPDTKRATITLLDATDLETLEDAPCYISASFGITEGLLHSSHVFRSHDIFEGWPTNVFSILRLHREVTQTLGVGLGNFTVTSTNAQVYERHWAEAEQKLDGWKDGLRRYRTNYLFDPDPMGNFHFAIDEETKQITVRLTTPSGDEVLWETVNGDPFALVHQMVELMPGLDDHHKIYLGSEARKLLIALRSGGDYVQD